MPTRVDPRITQAVNQTMKLQRDPAAVRRLISERQAGAKLAAQVRRTGPIRSKSYGSPGLGDVVGAAGVGAVEHVLQGSRFDPSHQTPSPQGVMASGPRAHPNAGIMGALKNVATLGEYQHPGGLRAEAVGVAQSLDPRSPAGLANLAAMFVPGAKGGGRFVGKMTPGQERLMTSLGNVTTEKLPPQWMIDNIAAKHGIEMAQAFRGYYLNQRGRQGPYVQHELKGHSRDADLQAMLDVLGQAKGNPLTTLIKAAGSGQKLGTVQDRQPSWQEFQPPAIQQAILRNLIAKSGPGTR